MQPLEEETQAIVDLALMGLDSAVESKDFYSVIQHSLTRKPFSPFWTTLPFLCCLAAKGRSDHGRVIAATVMLAMSAASIMDDVQDADTDDALWREIGAPQAINVSLALAFGAPVMLRRLQQADVPLSTVLQLYDECFQTVFTMCGGQHADLSTESGDGRPPLDRYWEIAAAKTAALFAWGCRTGASLGQHRSDLDAYSAFGHHLGMLDQTINDLEALYSLRGKMDFGGSKKSLPYLYALSVAPLDTRAVLEHSWGAAVHDLAKREHVRQLLFELGTPHYLRLVVEEHYQKAKLALRETDGKLEVRALLEAGLEQVVRLVKGLDYQGATSGLFT